jgi:hypothetical protein
MKESELEIQKLISQSQRFYVLTPQLCLQGGKECIYKTIKQSVRKNVTINSTPEIK